MKVAMTKNANVFCVEASEIKTKEDVQEVIHQLQLIEGQMVGGLGLWDSGKTSLDKGLFSISTDCTCRVRFSPNSNAISKIGTGFLGKDVFIKGRITLEDNS